MANKTYFESHRVFGYKPTKRFYKVEKKKDNSDFVVRQQIYTASKIGLDDTYYVQKVEKDNIKYYKKEKFADRYFKKKLDETKKERSKYSDGLYRNRGFGSLLVDIEKEKGNK